MVQQAIILLLSVELHALLSYDIIDLNPLPVLLLGMVAYTQLCEYNTGYGKLQL